MTVTLAGYLVLGLFAAALALAARLPGSRVAQIGDCVGPALRSRPGRIAVLAAWLWLGWHFFAR